MGGSTLDQSPSHHFVIEAFVGLVLLVLQLLNLGHDISAIVDSGDEASELDEACGAIEATHEELRVLLDGLRVGIECSVVIKALKPVVTLVFEPDGICVLNIDVHILVFLFQVLALGIGRLLELTLSGWQMSEFLLGEAHLDLLLLTDLGQVSLWGIWSLVLNIVLIVSCRGHLCLLCDFINFGLIRILVLGDLLGSFSRTFLVWLL